MKTAITAIAVAGVCLLTSRVDGAEQQAVPSQKKEAKITRPTAKGTGPAAAAPGMVVVKDADTGKLRAPTAEEAAALGGIPQDSSRTGGPATERPMAGGRGMALMLDGGTDVFAVATRDANGKLTFGEVVGNSAAATAVKQGPAKTASKELEQK